VKKKGQEGKEFNPHNKKKGGETGAFFQESLGKKEGKEEKFKHS